MSMVINFYLILYIQNFKSETKFIDKNFSQIKYNFSQYGEKFLFKTIHTKFYLINLNLL